MSQEINILDSTVYNLIAAGEVVERPLSIVKELVENSIDAGAKRISVELKDKLSKIIVADDGSGIAPTQMRKAFLAHATSKIATENDLTKIGTLGFRGEALASIAAVAHVTAVSRVFGSDLGAKIAIENGNIIEEGSVGSSLGTVITVGDIFKNLPARLKFLKKPSIEEGDIANLILRLILANPNVSIKLTTNGNIVYHSDGQGLKSAVNTAYGHQILGKMTEINYTDEIFEVKAFLGHPSLTKSSRGFGTIVINGRYIISSQLEKAVLEAYSPYLMKHQFPVYVFHVNLPLELVDVNVHPNKTEVRFSNDANLIQIIGKIVSDKINSLSRSVTAEIQQSVEPKEQIKTKSEFTVNTMSLPGFDKAPKKFASPLPPPQRVIINKPKSTINIAAESPQYEVLIKKTSYKNLCKLYNTYIVVEGDNGAVFLIDQHAAHERLIYDKFKAEYDTKKLALQPLLVPYVFTVLPNQSARIIADLDKFRSCGIVIDEWGSNTFRVTEISNVLVGCNLESLIAALLDGKSSGGFLEAQIISKACKAAVKGEADLKENEITALLDSIDQNSPPLFCPHGRPIIIRLDKAELDRKFKR